MILCQKTDKQLGMDSGGYLKDNIGVSHARISFNTKRDTEKKNLNVTENGVDIHVLNPFLYFQ